MNDQNENTEEVKVNSDALNLAKLTWDEYQYRHQLCWNLIFKITYVTAFLSIIPYLSDNIIGKAKPFVFYTPLLAIGVSIIGGARLYKELRLLDKIRNLHRIFQKKAYDKLYNRVFQRDLHDLKASYFTATVSLYQFFLTCLALLNFILMLC